MEIRAGVRENVLRDPSRVTLEDVCWFVDNPGIFVWVEDTRIVGFSAADPRNGNIFGLFVEEAYEGRGIARALFERACNVLDEAGCPRIWLTTWPGTRAERFYRRAGWQVTGSHEGNLVFERHGRSSPSEQLHDGQPDAIRHDFSPMPFGMIHEYAPGSRKRRGRFNAVDRGRAPQSRIVTGNSAARSFRPVECAAASIDQVTPTRSSHPA